MCIDEYPRCPACDSSNWECYDNWGELDCTMAIWKCTCNDCDALFSIYFERTDVMLDND